MQEQLGELRRFQAFLETLKADLAHAQEQRDRLLEEIQAYEELETNVKMLQQVRPQGRELKTCTGKCREGHGMQAVARQLLPLSPP